MPEVVYRCPCCGERFTLDQVKEDVTHRVEDHLKEHQRLSDNEAHDITKPWRDHAARS